MEQMFRFRVEPGDLLPPRPVRQQASAVPAAPVVPEEPVAPVTPTSATPALPAVPVPCIEVSTPQFDIAAPIPVVPPSASVVTPEFVEPVTPGRFVELPVAPAVPDASDVPVTAAPPEACASALAARPKNRAVVVKDLPNIVSSVVCEALTA